MFKKILNKIQDKYNTIKQENDVLDQLLQTTTTFNNLFPIQTNNQEILENKITTILNECPDINKEKAKKITQLIPIQETYLSIIYTKEILTNKEYYLIPTNQYLWVISIDTYGAFPYSNLTCQLIKNNLMSKIILLNNVLLEANGTTKIEKFLELINNPNYRNNFIQEKTAYLCNITPIYQKINSINSGISIDNHFNIVFHNQQENLLCPLKQLSNYEILLDNQVYLSKKSTTSTKMTSFQTSCSQISIRITTTDHKIFTMIILEPNTFNSKYTTHDSIFQTNLNFAKAIIDKLNEISPKTY